MVQLGLSRQGTDWGDFVIKQFRSDGQNEARILKQVLAQKLIFDKWVVSQCDQSSPIKENSEVVYRFVVFYFPGKFSHNKQEHLVSVMSQEIMYLRKQDRRILIEKPREKMPMSPANIPDSLLSKKWLFCFLLKDSPSVTS